MIKPKNIIIIGSRGLFLNYGGWEYYLNNLLPILSQKSRSIKIHVINFSLDIMKTTIKSINENLYVHELPINKEFNMVIKDLIAFKYAKKINLNNKYLYFLGVRVGIPLFFNAFNPFRNFKLIFNPAGIEWMRKKFSLLSRLYLYLSAYLMAKTFDFIISDSHNITKYYIDHFKVNKHKISTIPYGVAKLNKSDNISDILDTYKLKQHGYYLIISRFVPENSYEQIIKAFIQSKSKNKLVIVSNFIKEKKYFKSLDQIYHITSNKRILLIDSLYDNSKLNSLRFNCLSYINGNQLGGTNPGLLQAMVACRTIIAYDSIFAREVVGNNAYYFKSFKELNLVFRINKYKSFRRDYLKIIENDYLWEKISYLHMQFFERI